MSAFTNILVPIDLGEPSEHAVVLAVAMAQAFDAEVLLLHVSWMPSYYYAPYANGLAFPLEEMPAAAKEMFDATLTTAQGTYARTRGSIVAGEPWEKILEVAKESRSDLIVMGTHGRRSLARVFLGSAAEKIVRHSVIPVLTTGGPRAASSRS